MEQCNPEKRHNKTSIHKCHHRKNNANKKSTTLLSLSTLSYDQLIQFSIYKKYKINSISVSNNLYANEHLAFLV